MEVIYFSTERPGKACRLLEAVGRRVGGGQHITTVFDIEEFKREIAGRRGKESLALIVARDEQTLIDVYFARCLLSGVSSILVLPDQERLTTALAFRIRPDHILPADTGTGTIAWTVNGILKEKGRGYAFSRDLAGPRDEDPPTRLVPGGGKEAANF